jgi:hypothetical protein
VTDRPIACSLDAYGKTTRGEEWHDLLGRDVMERAIIPGGIRLVAPASGEVSAQFKRLIAFERSCCPWISWTVVEGASLRVDATARGPEGVILLREWFGP